MPCCPLHEERRYPLQKTDPVERRLVAGAIGGSDVVIGDTLPTFVYLPTSAVGIVTLLTNG